jgi:uncharacterized membrane protein YraQ (UPF0718 family)
MMCTMREQFDAWATLFNAMVLQALPFLVLGVVLSALVVTLVPARAWRWVLARPIGVAIPAAAACGALVPGCECTTVPVAGRLAQRGVAFPAALAFALASPALNPIVMFATATAFAGQGSMVAARFAASFVAVLVIGAYLAASGIQPPAKAGHHHHEPEGGGRTARVLNAAQHDLLHTVGLVVLGAAVAASMRVVLPADWLLALSSNMWVAVPAMAVLAVVLALCSESDAFVAASFVLFPPTAVLVFMVVGPIVDIRLLIMYRSVFGSRVAAAIAGFGLFGAISASLVVGLLLL